MQLGGGFAALGGEALGEHAKNGTVAPQKVFQMWPSVEFPRMRACLLANTWDITNTLAISSYM